MTHTLEIKIESSHEHPLWYGILNSIEEFNGNYLAKGIKSLKDYITCLKKGHKLGTDDSYHSLWIKEEYISSDIHELKKEFPQNVKEYNTHEGKIYLLTEIPSFIEGNKHIISKIKEVKSNKDIKIINYILKEIKEGESCGFSSYKEQYMPPNLLYILLKEELKDSVEKISDYLTTINLAWWDLHNINDEMINNIIQWCEKGNIDLGIKIMLDGSLGSGTAGLNDKSYCLNTDNKYFKKTIKFLYEYGDHIKYISFHAIGPYAIKYAPFIYELLLKKSNKSDAIPLISHVEIVNEDALRALDDLILKKGGYISPQINYLYPDISKYSLNYPILKNKKQLCPMKTFIKRYGLNKIKIGTDGMPLSLIYYLLSAYYHPFNEERLNKEDIYNLLEYNNRKEKGKKIKLNIPLFESLLSKKTAYQYLQQPYSKLRSEIDKEIIITK